MRTSLSRGRDWFWLLPLLFALAACGPGVGGTGTGEGYALEYFGARRASVCTASFAGELRCPSSIVVGPAPFEPEAGSEPVLWVDDPAGARIVVRFNVSDVDLTASCSGVRFAGTWGETEQGNRGFFGHFTAPGADAAAPGTLTVETVAGNGLSFTLSDTEGNLVLGPVALLRADADPAPSSCSTVTPTPLSGATFR
ncbi:MAG: hypothetical protein IPM30_08540 [Burkholderiales bacterium]|nr:hypothetical protein [Burkholderiales bacterium]